MSNELDYLDYIVNLPADSRITRRERDRLVQQELSRLAQGTLDSTYWEMAEIVEQEQARVAALPRDEQVARFNARRSEEFENPLERDENFAEMAAHYHSSFAPRPKDEE